MSYVPIVDDYVKWRNVEGWVYYVGEEYITIEVAVKDKPDNHVMFHQKIHCNVVCPCWNWDELKYVTNRREPEYKGQLFIEIRIYTNTEVPSCSL